MVMFVISLVSEILLIPDEGGTNNSTVKFHLQFLLAEESREQKFPFLTPKCFSSCPTVPLTSNYLLSTALKQATCSAF